MLALFIGNATWVLALVTALWLVSVRLKDASIVDPFWSILSLVVLVRTALVTGLTPGKVALLGLVTAWALRLFAHLLVRSLGHAEDPRYAAFRQRFGPERYWWVSFFQVFVLQGALALVVSAPLFVAGAAAAPDVLAWNDVVGGAIALVGFVIEAVADATLRRFRRDPANKGRVLDHGLFARSRHPNYFGECLFAWGTWLMAIDVGALGLASALGPALMTFLLLRVSGVTMLDAHLAKTRPGYAAYMARTPAFFPRLGRARAREGDS
ncbi:MAG: DUF1295 domain-containing protein [Polyangiaceae bacterium]